ncbi:VWA domain-containing protein [Thiocapsa marina]|uniref:von Willebrand factor type A n=1 Tax=Thiocapsa marina 5811 TaxID=768671 RepID=F9UH26_9GAMM|nr:VWA domain-containing protein [Thiocapsa marina]EGV16430.1 von Willebrand factor type A [Thiocapsa marina 5811]
MNSNSTLTNALPIVAAAYGRKFGVQIAIGGNEAKTNGKVIQIPAVADTAKSLAYGYLAHEAGHVRFTDFTLSRHTQPLGRFVEGILEDVRIENAMIRIYPGTRTTLDSVMDALIADNTLVPVNAQADPVEIFGNGLLHLSRHRYRHQKALRTHAKQADKVMRRVLGTRFVHRLHGLLTEIPTLASTTDSMALARKIVSLVEEEAQNPTPHPTTSEDDKHSEDDDQEHEQSAQGSEGEESEAENQEGEGADDGADGTESDTDNPQGEDIDDGSGGEQQSTENPAQSTENPAQGAESQTSDAQPVGSDIKNALQSALNATEEELPEDVFATVAETLSAESISSPTLLPTKEHYVGNPHVGRTALQRVKIHSSKLTARLQGLVQARTLTRHRTVQRGRDLSPARLHRAGVGDPRIFRTKNDKVAPNTALHLLVDLSGSMAGGQDRIALDAAMALALALEPINHVSRAVSAFPGLRGQDQNVTAILGHGERVASRAGAFVQDARGGTPMTGALWFGAADLLSRSEDRKVLLTLTDGAPNDVLSAKDLVTRATQAGIECIGVGIGVYVGRLFPVAVRIDDIADLKNELFKVAEKLLLR